MMIIQLPLLCICAITAIGAQEHARGGKQAQVQSHASSSGCCTNLDSKGRWVKTCAAAVEQSECESYLDSSYAARAPLQFH